MTWPGFDGRAYTRDEFATRVGDTQWRGWKPKGITLHNTAAPTLAQWAESGPSHDARIRNLQDYYENQLGWHAGPHLFISRTRINGFSDLMKPGVHSRCFNATHIGIEMVGDYNVEEFNSGDGALVRDNAVFALATLYRAMGASPYGLVFHKECIADNHDCPGHKVNKADVISRVATLMGYAPAVPTMATPWLDDEWQAYPVPRIAWLQDALNFLQDGALDVDGRDGALTKDAVRRFQQEHGLTVDGIAGDKTVPVIIAALSAKP